MQDEEIKTMIWDRFYNGRVHDDINRIKDMAYVVFNLWGTVEEYTKYNKFDPQDPKEFDLELYVPDALVEKGEYMIDYIRVLLDQYVDITWDEDPLYLNDTCQMLYVINGVWNWSYCCNHLSHNHKKQCLISKM